MILGSTSADFVVDADRHIYTPCANSITITSPDGHSFEWQPDQGLYEVTRIAIAPISGVICLSKKSLSVSLSFFKIPKCRKIGEIPSVAQVEIQQLVYSKDESILLVLSNYPSSTVKMLASTNPNALFAITKTIHLPDSFFGGLLFVKLHDSGSKLMTWGRHELLVYMLRDSESDYSQWTSHQIADDTITCSCVVQEGALFGFASGKVSFLDQARETLSVVTFCRCEVSCLSPDACSNSIFLCQTDGLLLRLSGSAPHYHLTSCCQLPSTGGPTSIYPLTSSPHSFVELLVGTSLGVHRCIEESGDWLSFPLRQRWDKPIKKCLALKDNQGIACIFSDGTLCTFSVEKNEVCEWRAPVSQAEGGEILDSCISATGKVILASEKGIFYSDPLHGGILDHVPLPLANQAYLRCAVNDLGTLICLTSEVVYFYHCTDATLRPCGCFETNLFGFLLTPKALCAVPGENAFLVAGASGEVFWIDPPASDLSMDAEVVTETLLKGAWRLDLPVEAMHLCYVSDEVINILVHSIDKDTKVYALGRHNEEEDTLKVIRATYLMRDHAAGGRCFCAVGASMVCSGGKDGYLVWRDISAYQKRLPSMPPSKEKRKKLKEQTVWHFIGGGLTSICVVGDMIACVGSQTSLLKMIPGATPIAHLTTSAWKEPEWISRRLNRAPCETDSLDATRKTLSVVEGKSETELLEIQQNIRSQLNQVRREWNNVVQTDWLEKVPAESLLPAPAREEFEATCRESVFRAKESEYYQLLENEHTQDVIKARCCATMEVARSKVVSLYRGFELHNFHIAQATRPNKTLSQKGVFLRKLQLKAGQSCRVVGVCESASQKVTLSENVLLASEKAIVSALYSPFEVYTQGRAVLQSILLKGVLLTMKDSFNARFEEIRQVKSAVLSAIEDKTGQCLRILKELGEESRSGELFTAYVDPEEKAEEVFTVRDEELDERVRRLIPPKQESCIVSASNEAALKLWMDGLEKDVARLQVSVPLPGFADESSSAFVPQDERTEEQLQLMERYETQIREQTDALNARKDELRSELARLQGECRTLATNFDAKLREAGLLRAATAKTLHEIDLDLVLLLEHRLRFFDTVKKFDALQGKITSLLHQVEKTSCSVEAKQRSVASMHSAMQGLEEKQRGFLSKVRACEPFVDESYGDKLYRRFVRWKRVFEGGKSALPCDDRPPDGIPPELWVSFCDRSRDFLQLCERIVESRGPSQQEEESLKILKTELEALDNLAHELESERDGLCLDLLDTFLNTRCLYHLHQGQIQDEKLALTSDFNTSRLRWVTDVDQYNQAIFSSATKSDQLLSKIVHRRFLQKQRDFERKRLDYCTGTFKLELQQLHTLRVTRLMQEWLCGDAEVSEEKAVGKIRDHVQFVNLRMARKIDQLRQTIRRLKGQIVERASENSFVAREREKLHCTVQDIGTVKSMIDTRTNFSHQIETRAREIFQLSEMEEMARSQDEELERLKKEVDRLRAKTFPAFAPVCKRV